MKRGRFGLPAAQRGAATVIAAAVLIVTVALMAQLALDMSATDATDTGMTQSGIDALFVAESGLERATYRLANDAAVACDGTLAETVTIDTRRTLTIAGGATTDFSGAALPSGSCRVSATATVAPYTVVRSAEGIVTTGSSSTPEVSPSPAASGDVQLNTITWSHTVSAGNDRFLLVGVSLPRRGGNSGNITGVTYGGQTLTLVGSQNQSQARVEIWSLLAPNTGTANVVVSFNGNIQSGSGANTAVGGSVSFSGVDQASPIEASNFNGARSTSPSVTVTPVTAGSWVVDVLAYRDSSTPPTSGVPASPDHVLAWAPAGGAGAASTFGPVAGAGAVTMGWSLPANVHWALGAVVVKPAPGGAGSTSIVQWREAITPP